MTNSESMKPRAGFQVTITSLCTAVSVIAHVKLVLCHPVKLLMTETARRLGR
jgi:hypothetical protein